MKARTASLSVLFLVLFAISATAQQYYQPVYSQHPVQNDAKAPVFIDNDTGGLLSVKFEVNGVIWPVRIMNGHMVSDLMVPVNARMRVKEANTLVFEDDGNKERNVKHCHYYSESLKRQGWYFYRGRSTGPCE